MSSTVNVRSRRVGEQGRLSHDQPSDCQAEHHGHDQVASGRARMPQQPWGDSPHDLA
jgi:hypothetical protein